MRQLNLTGPKSGTLSTMVSEEDFEFLSERTWYIVGPGYVGRTTSVRIDGRRTFTVTLIHRVIAERMGLRTEGRMIDHRNGNPLDNRRENLRSANHQQNGANRGAGKNNRFGHKGITYRKDCNLWQAKIKIDGKTKSLGNFKTPSEATAAYLKAAMVQFGEFART